MRVALCIYPDGFGISISGFVFVIFVGLVLFKNNKFEIPGKKCCIVEKLVVIL